MVSDIFARIDAVILFKGAVKGVIMPTPILKSDAMELGTGTMPLKELLAIDRQAGVKAGLQGSMTKMIRCVKPLLTMLMRPNIVRNH